MEKCFQIEPEMQFRKDSRSDAPCLILTYVPLSDMHLNLLVRADKTPKWSELLPLYFRRKSTM